MFVVGVDGCKSGWFAVKLADDDRWDVDTFPNIESLWEKNKNARLILIDIPIGLREKDNRERCCDTEARKILGRIRASSVFPAPCRPSLAAQSYKEACDINECMTGRRLSCQTWNILSKIREVDNCLNEFKQARSKIREVHPEICFWGLAGRQMEHSKKSVEGYEERKRVLEAVYSKTSDIIDQALANSRRKDLAKDDILDAIVAAVTALLGKESLRSIPHAPELDSNGLPMEMIFCMSE